MLKFFRKIRQKLLAENKLTRYLLYALGEILLVVIGILIALGINNWNEERKSQEALNKIYERLIVDMESDIIGLNQAIRGYENMEYVFRKVMNDSITPELFDVGLSRIVRNTNFISNLKTTGIQQLKDINTKDPLALSIISWYDNYIRQIAYDEGSISNISLEFNNHVRSNYPWFVEWMSKTIMKDNSSQELQDYFLNSMEYRNYVADTYNSIYNNYLPTIENLKITLLWTVNQLKIKLDPDLDLISKEQLDEFTGTYEIIMIDCPGNTEFKIGNNVKIDVFEYALLVGYDEAVFSLYHVGKDQFSDLGLSNGDFQFERDKTKTITGFKVLSKTDEHSCIINFKKLKDIE